jgi:protein-tyrosine kinase
MSKIFEAVNKGRDDLADSIRPLILPAPEQLKSEAPVEAVPVNPSEGPMAPAKELLPAQIRRLPLRLAAPSPLFPFDADCWQASEQYRILRAKLGHHPRQPRLIVISSPGPKDGKSVSAVNIAGALSLKDQAKVLLLEGDMRRPTLDVRLGMPKVPGLADILLGACSLEEALVQTEEFPNLYVMAAGTTPSNPAELLERAQWAALCTRLRSLFRYTIVDSPPMAAVADFDLIQAVCDGVILVVRPDRTDRDLCKKSLEHVTKNKLLGVLMNCVPDWLFARNTSYEYYYQPGQRKA